MKRGLAGILCACAVICSSVAVKPLVFKALAAESGEKKLVVFYAAGLNTAMQQLFKEFKQANPGIEVIGESSGSLQAARKITELNKRADLLFVADYTVINDLLISRGYAEWYINFYGDRVVLAYTDKSLYTSEIGPDNWYKVLLRQGVRYAYANPNLAPIGYRTLLVWKLADFYYSDGGGQNISGALANGCAKEYVMPDVGEMLHLLESLSLDYAFVYESTAKQHNLKYIKLPAEIDLGSEEFAQRYSSVSVEVVSKKTGAKEVIKGTPAVFSVTIPNDAANTFKAKAFLGFFFSRRGREIMSSCEQPLLQVPTLFGQNKIPEEVLKSILNPE